MGFQNDPRLAQYKNNQPVADFFCEKCAAIYELKSKKGSFSRKVGSGSYGRMIERITSDSSPDFFFLAYDHDSSCVRDLFLILHHFFVPSVVEERRPLKENAKRRGWIGANILLKAIPEYGRICIIKNGMPVNKNLVLTTVKEMSFLNDMLVEMRG